MRKHSETLSAYSSSEEAISFSGGNPFFFLLQYFPTSKAKTRINIKTLGLNNKTLQNQIKQTDLFNQNSTKTRSYKFDSLNKKNDFYFKSLEMRKLRPCEVEEGLAK